MIPFLLTQMSSGAASEVVLPASHRHLNITRQVRRLTVRRG